MKGNTLTRGELAARPSVLSSVAVALAIGAGLLALLVGGYLLALVLALAVLAAPYVIAVRAVAGRWLSPGGPRPGQTPPLEETSQEAKRAA